MMSQVRYVLLVALVALFGTTEAGAQGGLKPGGKFDGELKTQASYAGWPGFVDSYTDYAFEVPIVLKAGQSISLSVTVLGKDRKVSMALMDSTGKIIAATKRRSEIKTAQLEVEEVSATGKYKIIVLSDRIGGFTLRATDPNDKKQDEKALRTEIEELEQKLADLKKKLEARKKKSK